MKLIPVLVKMREQHSKILQEDRSKHCLTHISPFCPHFSTCGHPFLTNYILDHSRTTFSCTAAPEHIPDAVMGCPVPCTNKVETKYRKPTLIRKVILYFKRLDKHLSTGLLGKKVVQQVHCMNDATLHSLGLCGIAPNTVTCDSQNHRVGRDL